MSKQLEWLDKISILGLTLQVTTKFQDKFCGEVFFYNPKTNILILSKFPLKSLLNLSKRRENCKLKKLQLHIPKRKLPNRTPNNKYKES
jgi:hypothetical protein